MKNKNKNKKIFNALLTLCAALVLMGGFSVTAYAQTPEGQDDATDDSGVVYEEPEKEEPLTPDGNATLVDDFGGNKQLITVTTKNGNYFYILIDRDDKGENTVHLNSELEKIALAHQGPDAVGEREVRSLVARTSEVKPWALTDAFSERNLAQCLALLAKMESSSPHALIAMCTGRVRDLLGVQSLRARGDAAAIARTLKVPDWKVRNFNAWARNFTPAELRRALATSRDAERAMKSGADPDAVFYRWLVDTLKRR